MKRNSLYKKFVLILAAFILISCPFTSIRASEVDSDQVNVSETKMRMQPLVEKYKGLSQADLDGETAKYSDVPTHWGKNYISKISALEIINGYGTKFGPNDRLLGGQFILMLIRTMGFKPDTPAGTPYYKPYADIAIKEGILKKDEIKDFLQPITRELAASLARRVVGTYEIVPKDYFVKGDDPYPAKGDKGFFDNVYAGYQKLKMTDYPAITSKYLQDAIDCYRMGIMGGSNNKFSPKSTLTRAEGSVIIVKLLDKDSRVESVPGPNESFKWTNTVSNNGYYPNEEYGEYENKEYTIYKGLFPLMEIWDTAQAMYKNTNLITGGKIDFLYNEKEKGFGFDYFNDEKHFNLYFNGNYNALILPLNGIGIATQRVSIKKGESESLYDSYRGWLYKISSYEVDKYNKDLKDYSHEILKVWFGDEYELAKKIHDQYLSYALNDQEWKEGIFLINGRQIAVGGGHGASGDSFEFKVWAKGFITRDTMIK